MASIQANGSKGHHKFILTVTQGTQSIPNNTTPVSYKFQIAPVQTSWNWEQWGSSISYSFSINGTKYTGTIPNYDGYSTVTLKSGTQNVTHNADGTKSIAYSFSVTDTSGQSYTSGNASASGTMALTKIPRYATSTQSLKSKTETTITMNWSSDNTVDYIWYSKDNGSSWSGIDVTDGKSGSYTISGLSANTSYNIKTRVRRKDSQLTTDSSALSVTTYAYPYCTETPDYMLGESLTIKFFNPLSRSITWQLGIGEGTVVASGTSSGTSASVSIGASNIDKMYASIPNSKEGLYYVKVMYDNKGFIKSGGKYYITGLETPSIQSVTYYDSNTTTVAITGNNQHIVQNKSNLKVQVAEALTTFGAGSIEQYTLTYNGKVKIGSQAGTFDLGVIDSSKNITVELQVRDSRGMIEKKTITVTMLAHSSPTATVTLERLNNYEDETYLTVDGSISSVNSKNTMAIKYRYKQSGGSYGSYTTTTDKQKNTLSLDKNKSYIFEVVVTDAFGSSFTKEYVLNKGVFPFFIDTEKNSLGMNAFPKGEKVFELDGSIVEHNREFAIPTSAGEYNGWYLALSGKMTGYQNRAFMIAIQQTYNGGAGILYINLRCNNSTTLTISRCNWLTFNTIANENVCLTTNGNEFYLYLRTTASHQQYYLTILQEKKLNGENYNLYTVNKPSMTDTVTAPTGTNPTDIATALGLK